MRKLLALLVVLPALAFATPTQVMTDQAKKDFVDGVNLAANTYKLALITNTSTAGAGATTWASISANETAASGTYATGGATLAGRASSISSNHACVTFTSPVTFTSFTGTVRAAVVYNSTTGNIVSIHCLDGGACTTDYGGTSVTLTINLPSGGTFCAN